MKYLKLYTAIRLDDKTIEKLMDTMKVLEGITDDLDALSSEEGTYDQLHDDAWHAYACLSDFLESYDNRAIS